MAKTTKIGKPELKNGGNTGSRFKKGNRGRPKGALNKATGLRVLLEPFNEKLVNKLVKMALKGNAAAMRLCIERLIPSLKPVSEPVMIDLPGVTLTERATSIFKAAASGSLSTDDARQFMELIAQCIKVEEGELLRQRIAALEQILQEKGE